MNEYAELQTTTNFSFLRGASHPEEFVIEAARLKYKAIAITDHNSLAGIVRGHSAAKALKDSALQYIVGCRLNLKKDDVQDLDYISLLVYPSDLSSYRRLSRLLSIGKMRSYENQCLLTLDDFFTYMQGLAVVAIPPLVKDYQHNLNFLRPCTKILEGLKDKQVFSIALSKSYQHHSFDYVKKIVKIAKQIETPLVATNDVYYHCASRKALQDILTCIRNKTTIDKAGYLLFPNAERYLKSPKEMQRLFKEYPKAIKRSLAIAEMTASFSLDLLKYEYPNEICPKKKSPAEYLKELVFQGAQERYQAKIPKKIKELLISELKLIHELKYEQYFLTCYDIVQYARSKKILCQGRGAAANSAVCFCLGITAVDPEKIDLLFARFVSKERNEPPDIDIDFEHERREEVIQYIYRKYGRERAALACEVVSYRGRSAVRDVGKALGLSLPIVNKLCKAIHHWTGSKLKDEELKDLGLNPQDRVLQHLIKLSKELQGFPRHLSQHVGGFIISENPLCETVPILNASMQERSIIEWDKDDIEALGMLKIDILALGILSCIRKALKLINQARPEHKALELYSIPSEDQKVYDMLCASDTIGVFQIESRAQMSMLPRLRPRCFYDLVIEVAIVRPGPIQGKMVHPFLKRRNGQEKVHYPDNTVKAILGKTLGVPIFQEQAMRLAISLAGFSPGEAELLRRSMAAWKKNKSLIMQFKDRILAGMQKKGYSTQFATNCVNQLKGFSEYGFPESHAASFALLVYATAWIKRYHPAIFATALINSQPMGFYAPAQIISDAKKHGVRILEIDVNFSHWDCQIVFQENQQALRLGMRLIKGFSKEQAYILTEALKAQGPFNSIQDIWHKARMTGILAFKKHSLYLLAKADAFSSLQLSRRAALWQIRALANEALPIDNLIKQKSKVPPLKAMGIQQSMFCDIDTTGLSLKAHPFQFLRKELDLRKVSTAATLKASTLKNQYVSIAGIALFRQRPGSAKGVVFITLEDETGITNLIVRPHIFEKYQKLILSRSYLLAHGKLERVGEVVYILVKSLESLGD